MTDDQDIPSNSCFIEKYYDLDSDHLLLPLVKLSKNFGTFFVLSTSDGTILILALSSRTPVLTIPPPISTTTLSSGSPCVSNFILNPEEDELLVAYKDGNIIVYRLDQLDQSKPRTIPSPQGHLLDMIYHPFAPLLAILSTDSHIDVLNRSEPTLSSIPTPSSVAHMPSIGCHPVYTLTLWDMVNDSLVAQYPLPLVDIIISLNSIIFSPDGLWIAIPTQDIETSSISIHIWELASASIIHHLRPPSIASTITNTFNPIHATSNDVITLDVSSFALWIAVGVTQGSIYLWNIENMGCITLNPQKLYLHYLTISSLPTMESISDNDTNHLNQYDWSVKALGFTQDGKTLIVATPTHLNIWKINSSLWSSLESPSPLLQTSKSNDHIKDSPFDLIAHLPWPKSTEIISNPIHSLRASTCLVTHNVLNQIIATWITPNRTYTYQLDLSTWTEDTPWIQLQKDSPSTTNSNPGQVLDNVSVQSKPQDDSSLSLSTPIRPFPSLPDISVIVDGIGTNQENLEDIHRPDLLVQESQNRVHQLQCYLDYLRSLSSLWQTKLGPTSTWSSSSAPQYSLVIAMLAKNSCYLSPQWLGDLINNDILHEQLFTSSYDVLHFILLIQCHALQMNDPSCCQMLILARIVIQKYGFIPPPTAATIPIATIKTIIKTFKTTLTTLMNGGERPRQPIIVELAKHLHHQLGRTISTI